MEDFDAIGEEVTKHGEELHEMIREEISRSSGESETVLATTKKVLFVVSLISLITGLLLGIFMSRSIARRVVRVMDHADRIAGGDLTGDIRVDSSDEIGRMLAAMKTMVEKLRGVVADVKTAADNVASGSQQLSAGAEQLSQGTTEQAASAEEASSSVEEMNATIRQNADNAQQTEKIALKSAGDGTESGRAVTEAVAAMKNIAEKITIIEEIARQTFWP
jgi:methyl-accepting chemotaxis protein